jgi:hypothetical protein
MQYDTMPEELRVLKVWVTKGFQRKKIVYHGRGQFGMGLIRKTHVNVQIGMMNWDEVINNPKLRSFEKKTWINRQKFMEKLKKDGPIEYPIVQLIRKRNQRERDENRGTYETFV